MTPSVLPQLQIFITVARLRSFTRAARELGVSTSAVSQAVRQLEEQLRVPLLVRTTRSVSTTEAGQRLVDGADGALRQAMSAVADVAAGPGEAVGHLRISVPHIAAAKLLPKLLPRVHAKHPRLEIEIVAEDRLVDIVAEGFDAGIRLEEFIARDMVRVRLTKPFRFIVVASPDYLARHGTPQRPEDLLRHQCLTSRSPTTGAPYAWELERGRRNWRVPVRGPLMTNHSTLRLALAEAGLGLMYAFEPVAKPAIEAGRLKPVLEPFAATVPGFFLYYPSHARSSPALKLFIEIAKTTR